MAEKPEFGYGATFYIPLSKDDFTALGIIATTFGQIEGYVDAMVLRLSRLKSSADLEVFYDGRQFGAKVIMLKRLAANAKTKKAERAIAAACAQLESIAPLRNQAIHGAWGTIVNPGQLGDGESAAWSPRTGPNFLRAKALPTLVLQLEECAKAVHSAMVLVFPGMASDPLPWKHRFGPEEPSALPAKSSLGRPKPIEIQGRKPRGKATRRRPSRASHRG
jgi:hypothetical protein